LGARGSLAVSTGSSDVASGSAGTKVRASAQPEAAAGSPAAAQAKVHQGYAPHCNLHKLTEVNSRLNQLGGLPAPGNRRLPQLG
jgi:hypothetical protein